MQFSSDLNKVIIQAIAWTEKTEQSFRPEEDGHGSAR